MRPVFANAPAARRARWLMLLGGAALALTAPLPLLAQKRVDPPADAAPRVVRVPQVRELWTPASELDAVLAHYPRAVALSREQFEALLHDAQPKEDSAKSAPPADAVLRQARLEGWLIDHGANAAAQVRVVADLAVEILSDHWAEVPLGLPDVALASAELDGREEASASSVAPTVGSMENAALVRQGGENSQLTTLLIRGRGPHRLRLSFLLPVNVTEDGNRIVLPRVRGAAAELMLHLPGDVRASSSLPCAIQPDAQAPGGGTLARVVLPMVTDLDGKPPKHTQWMAWKTENPASPENGLFNQETTLEYTVEETGIAARMAVNLQSPLGKLPGELRLPLPPPARAVRLTGGAVRRWDVSDNVLRVEPAPEDGSRELAFVVEFQLPLALDPQGVAARAALPVPEFSGAHGVTGKLILRRAKGMQIQRLEPGAALTAKAGLLSREREEQPDFVASFVIADLPQPGSAAAPPTLTVDARRIAARFSVDADVLADFQPTGITLERTLTFHVEQGEIFSARIVLPKGEELLAVTDQNTGKEADWRREGDEVVIAWKAGLSVDAAAPEVVKLKARAELPAPAAGANANAAATFEIGVVAVRGAERLAGYIALKAAAGYRLLTQTEDKLERRDGRTTPVRGDIAWFYRDNFRLAVGVERAAARTEARFVGYALPLAGAVEIHAQFNYQFLFSGVKSVRVRVPRETASAFYFTGDHIAERTLEADVWTIRFQGERTGTYALGVRATLPCPAQSDDPTRFHFRLPALTPLDAERWSGTWAVEANSDTEIRFAVAQAGEADALRAPELAGYQPQRRVIGVFDFIGGQNPAIDLDGVRHPAAKAASAVVDYLKLETFVSTSGAVRHHATLLARTAGDQFFNIRLPKKAALWSLTLDGELIKPIGGPEGELRVELPGGRPPDAPSRVEIVCETPGKAWKNGGRERLRTPRFDADVPVVKSSWRVWLPDGFDYQGFDSGLTPQAPPRIGLLLPGLGRSALSFLKTPFAAKHDIEYFFDTARAVTEVNLKDAPVQEMIAPLARQMPDALPPPADDPEMLSQLADINKPKFLDQVRVVQQFFKDAQEYFDTGRYDMAFKRYEQILAIDPANIAARRGEERVNAARLKNGETAYDAARSKEIWEAAKGWERPVRRYGLDANAKRGIAVRRDDQGTTAISRKLASIIIPKIEFRQTTVRDAIEFLRQESRRLDTKEANPESRGVNIFLKLTPSGDSSPSAVSLPNNTADARIPGLDIGPAPNPGVPQVPMAWADTRITLTLNNIPLLEALRYVAQQAGLKVKVETYAVSIVPLTELTDALITSEFRVPSVSTPESANGGNRDVTGAGTATVAREDAKAFLEARGVTFRPGASATYLPSTGKIVMRNTQENMDLLETIVGQIESMPEGKASVEKVAGLLPIKLDLPTNGHLYEFNGEGTPGELSFRYLDWRASARWRWAEMALGALMFLLLSSGSGHPWRCLFGGMLALTFFPLIVAPSTVGACNALLAGWLLAALGRAVTRFLLRRKLPARASVAAEPIAGLAALVLLVVAVLPTGARAADAPTPAASPQPEVVIVPYDVSKPVADQRPERLYLPYERFLELWDAAKRNRKPPAPESLPNGTRWVLSAARYDGKILGEALQIEGTLDLQTFGEGWVSVPLNFADAPLAALTLDGAAVSLNEKNELWVANPGTHRVTASLRLATPRLAAGTRLAWSIPRAAAATFTLTFPQRELRASVASAAGTVEEDVPEGKRMIAALGAADRVELEFSRAAPTIAQNAAALPPLANIASKLTAEARRETVRAQVAFAFSGGSQDHFSVYLDRGLTLTDLDAPNVKTWRLNPGSDRQTLEITLTAPARDAYRIGLTLDRPLENLSAVNRSYPYFSAQAGRVEQSAALLADAAAVELSLSGRLPAGVRQIPRPDESKAAGEKFFGAYAFTGSPTSGAGLTYAVRPAAGRLEARINYLYQIGRGKIELAAAVRLNDPTGERPILGAELRLPGDFVIQTVEGQDVREWHRDGDTLLLRFHAPEPGSVRGASARSLLVYLVRQFERPLESFALRPIVASGFADTQGEAVATADRTIKVSLALPAGVRARDLSEIDAQTAAPEFQTSLPLERQRAFRYRGAEFDVTAALSAQPARGNVGWVTHASVMDGAASWQTRVNLEVTQGAVDALTFTLPAALPEAHIEGSEVREALSSLEPGGGKRVYHVAFQNPVYGETNFTVNLDLPLNATGKVALPDLLFPGENLRAAGGFFLVENASSGEMSLNPRALDPATPADAPFLPAQYAAGTRFFRAAPGTDWALEISLSNLEKTAGRAALVAYAELTSALRSNGEEWHRAVYRLQNRRLQFLPVELPAGVEFIGARVAEESVRVDSGQVDGRAVLLVPLLRTRPGETSYDVELTYRRPANNGLGRLARRHLDDPRLPGIPVEKTLWDVWLPSDCRVLSSGGNMESALAALNETEKLESALSDLQSLSATVASRNATADERSRAYSNFNRLNDYVAKAAKDAPALPSMQVSREAPQLKQKEVLTQNALITRKRAEILNEAANVNRFVQQNNQSGAAPSGQVFGAIGGFGGFSGSYGQAGEKGRGAADDNNNSQAYAWRDNRGQQSQAATVGGNILPRGDNKPQNAKRAGQLALNDQVAVAIPDLDASRDVVSTKDKNSQEGQKRLSTARALELTDRDPADALKASPPQSSLFSSNISAGTLSINGPQAVSAPSPPTAFLGAVPVAPLPTLASAAPARPALDVTNGYYAATDAGQRAASPPQTQTLRSAGRLSLAVTFPLEGQVYHYKKIKSDADLTLWLARPGGFAWLGWLAALAALLAGWWALDRLLSRWRLRHLEKRGRRQETSARTVGGSEIA